MTEIRVDTIVDAAGTGAPDFSTAPTVGGVALGSLPQLVRGCLY